MDWHQQNYFPQLFPGNIVLPSANGVDVPHCATTDLFHVVKPSEQQKALRECILLVHVVKLSEQ